MSHTKLGTINIYQAQSITIRWSWDITNDSGAALWASQHIEFKHDIGLGTRWGGFRDALDILMGGTPSYGGADEPWVVWEPGLGTTTDEFVKLGRGAVVSPDRSAHIPGSAYVSFTGVLELPGPALNAALQDFWDERSDDGAQFHLKLALYQQNQENLKMSDSQKLDDHDFSFLFGISTDTPPLRVLDRAEQPSIGITVQGGRGRGVDPDIAGIFGDRYTNA